MSSLTGTTLIEPPILLFSGGLDSLIGWHLLGKPQPVFVCLGHRYMEAEIQTIRYLMNQIPGLNVHMVDRLFLGDLEQSSGYIPLRNLLLASVVIAEFSPPIVYLGAVAGESVRDKSDRFLRDATLLHSYLTHKSVRILAPLKKWTKSGLVREFLRLYPNHVSYLEMTRSCYNEPCDSEFKGCGKCMACFRRWVAMSLNGIEESYRSPPPKWEHVTNYSWRDALTVWKSVDIRDWVGLARSNYDAWRALRRY